MDPVVQTESLTKSYGSTVAINDLTLEVPAGVIGLVGANGAGKTTFFRLLLGLISPSAGDVHVVGRRVADDAIGLRERIGYMPEHDCLPLDQTAADVVSSLGELSGLPRRQARTRASEVLDLVDLAEERFRPISAFSTGMRQRTKLAQAIVADPALVLLDEPTNGLDPSGRDDMLALVRRLGTFGVSVILATHILDDVQKTCDYVVMLDGGRLVAAGRTTDLLAGDSSVAIEVDGPLDGLLRALMARGLRCDEVDGRVEVSASTDESYDAIRDVVAELDLPLIRLGSRGSTLEDVFRREANR